MENSFYKKAADYWATVEPTVEGVLGGFGFISEVDLEGSRIFLEAIIESDCGPDTMLALDCGAGIGRISKGVLVSYFDKVDLVEQNAKFLEFAKILIEENKLGNLFPVGLQHFKPATNSYDVIWCQWVLGHLTDNDLVDFLYRCIESLRGNGVIIVKENVTSSGKVEKDDIDSSVTRPITLLLKIFKSSKLKVVKQHRQNNFPVGIYPVYIFALKPKKLKMSVINKTVKATETSDDNLIENISKLDQISEKISNIQL